MRMSTLFMNLLNVFDLLLSLTPLRLCPFIPGIPGTVMSTADDFQDRPVRVSSLSPSRTTRISVFPYTLLLGILSQDVSPPSVIRVTHFSLRDVCSPR